MERQHREWDEQERRQKEEAERQRREKERLDHLHSAAEQWQQAKLLREYIEAVEQNEGPVSTGSDLERWLAWARNEADRIDPLTEGG
jgi:hypothetical protein